MNGTVKQSGVLAAVTVAAAMVMISGIGKSNAIAAKQTSIQTINSVDEFKSIIENAGDRLLVFDLYADWCMPCKVLSPQLEKVAREKSAKATIYKINVDKHPGIAGAFGVRGIPFVVFVKQQTAVHAITGVQPKEAYARAIDEFSTMEVNKPES